jgi:protein-tyrosine kinase
MAIKIKAKTTIESRDSGGEDCTKEVIAYPKSGEVKESEEVTSKAYVMDQPLSLNNSDFEAETYTAEATNQAILCETMESKEDASNEEVFDRAKLGWHSPNYSMSRSIVLDPEVLHANRCIAFNGESTTIDSYKVLRAQILQRMTQSGGNTLMVTSVLPGEGKTTTAINLAFIMAKEFQQTVLLVDCDLQQQDIHKKLGYPSDMGLINYLLDDCPITDLFTWPGIEKITLISGGRTIRDSSELLGSPRMKDLVSDMKLRYPNRFVIFDMQSCFAGADTMVFAPLVDNILVVVQEGNASTKEIKRAISLLPQEKLLGLMLNRHKAASHIVTPSNSLKNG